MTLRTLLLVVPALLLGCGGDAHDHDHDHGHDHDHDHDHGGHAHVHVAPHGGALVVLGDEALHVEFVLEARAGALTAYVLDGEAERAVRVAEESLTLTVTPPDGASVDVTLAAVANDLTGEIVGDTSEFHGTSEALVGLERFEATLGPLEARGVSFEAVAFAYPDGNE